MTSDANAWGVWGTFLYPNATDAAGRVLRPRATVVRVADVAAVECGVDRSRLDQNVGVVAMVVDFTTMWVHWPPGHTEVMTSVEVLEYPDGMPDPCSGRHP